MNSKIVQDLLVYNFLNIQGIYRAYTCHSSTDDDRVWYAVRMMAFYCSLLGLLF